MFDQLRLWFWRWQWARDAAINSFQKLYVTCGACDTRGWKQAQAYQGGAIINCECGHQWAWQHP